jgi:cation diffusion facilitator CzcD-associated flavoprotein CzcO
VGIIASEIFNRTIEHLTLIRIAVIGGGVTGLSAAHRLRQLLPAADVQLYEAG